jgi:site-specific recombinase XerD
MDNPIVPFARPILTPALPSVGSIDMYGCLLADAKNPRTLQARIDDIRDLGKFLGVSDPAACVALVIGATRGQGAAVAIGWQKHMLDKGLSGATINRRLSTLRRLCKLAGPLFTRLDRAGGGRSERLTGHGVHDLVRQLGAKAGLARPTRPHALRHEGATRLLELTGGNVRAVQRWTRHADVKTVLTYDDNREDLAGSLVRALGEDV